jgi:hypothetical protein
MVEVYFSDQMEDESMSYPYGRGDHISAKTFETKKAFRTRVLRWVRVESGDANVGECRNPLLRQHPEH